MEGIKLLWEKKLFTSTLLDVASFFLKPNVIGYSITIAGNKVKHPLTDTICARLSSMFWGGAS